MEQERFFSIPHHTLLQCSPQLVPQDYIALQYIQVHAVLCRPLMLAGGQM